MPGPTKAESITYLAYLEEMVTMYPYTLVEAPGLGELRPRPAILKRKFVRARFSGIRAALFNDMREIVGPARDGVLSPDQRDRRRAELQEAFKRFSIPVIDLFWSAYDPQARRRRYKTMRLHHWFELNLTRGNAETAGEPVFMGEPDPTRPAEPAFEAGQLVGLRALTPREEEPLRDIFSLAHIPDANLDEDPDGPSGRSPPDDDDGGGPDTASATTSSAQEEQVEAVHERLRAVHHGRAKTDRDDQQYVTIGR